MAKHNKISGQFAARLIEMMESPAYRVLSLSAHRALSRIEIEWAHHGGQDNGKLPVTFDDFVKYGVHRTSVGPALAELEALGFIEITERGKMARAAEYRQPNKFLLTSRAERKGVEPLLKWRRFKSLEEAEAAAGAARDRGKTPSPASGEIQKPPVRKPYQRPVRKPYQRGQNASTETVPLRLSEIVPLSISRGGTPPLGEGSGAGPSRLTTPASLPLTLVADAPQPDLPLECPTDRADGKAVLAWSRPVVTELFGDEARARRAQVERAEMELAEILAMRAPMRLAIAI